MSNVKDFNIGDLVGVLKSNIKVILSILVLFFIMGLINYKLSPKEYISSTQILPVADNSGKVSSSLGNLAGLAGISLNSSTEGYIPTNLYPDIMMSTPFSLNLMYRKMYYPAKKDSIFLIQYFSEFTEPSAMAKLKRIPFALFSNSPEFSIDYDSMYLANKDRVKNNRLLVLSSWENGAKSQITSRISATVDNLTGTITVQAKTQDPEVSALVTEYALEYLSDYLIDYKIGREKNNLEFAEERLAEVESRHKELSLKLANFQDRNLNITLASAQVKRQELENELAIAYNVYNGLAQEVEQSKIRVQRLIPVFKVLDPATVARKESSPKLVINLVVFLFLGVFVSFIWLIIKELNV